MNEDSEKTDVKKPRIPIDSKKLRFLDNFIKKNTEILNNEKLLKFKKEKASGFQCKFCFKTFTCSPSVSRHKKVCPLNESAKQSKSLVCQVCNNTFSRTDGLKVHMKRCSMTSLKKYKNCLYQNCDVKFYHKQALMQHLTNSHGQIFQKEVQKIFPNEQAFYSWKEETEESTFSYFSKKNGKKANIQYFYCQQDGESKGAKRKTNRKNVKGQIRSGKTCIASMKVMKIENSGVLVKFQPMHCHTLKPEDLKHHPLSKNTYELINEQLVMGLSPKQIMKSLEGKSPMNVVLNETIGSRKNDFVTVHRIQGIARLRRVKLREDPDDSVSLTKLVRKFMKDLSNPFILYKPQRGDKLIGPDEVEQLEGQEDLFMLGIQTPEQEKVYESNAANVLSINIAHGTNKYDYPLLTVIVPDEYHRGHSVAHFISSRMDINTISCFLLAVRNKNPHVTINCVVTNDDPALSEAVRLVFGDQVRLLLCLWLVNNTFHNYLTSFAPVESRDEMFSLLNLLISSENEVWFTNIFDNFVWTFKEVAPKFIELLENYRDIADKWALCYRNFPHGEIDSVLLNEAFLNRLKATCTKKKANWRLDDLTTLLLEIEQDDYESRLKEKVLGLPFGLNDTLHLRHDKGLKIPNEDVIEQFPNHWAVSSQSSKEKKYYVSRCNQTCKYDPCPNVCPNILCYKLCVHLYFCTCTDKSPICKHIHKVHSLLTKVITIPADEINSLTNIKEESVTLYNSCISEAETVSNKVEMLEPPVEEIDEHDSLNMDAVENIPEESLIEVQMTEEEEIVEEIIITDDDIDVKLEWNNECHDRKLKIDENLSKLSNILLQENISDSFLDCVHSSLQSLLTIAKNNQS